MTTIRLAIAHLLLGAASLAAAAAPSVDYLQPLSLAPQSLEGRSLADHARQFGVGTKGSTPWYALFWREGELQLENFRGFRERAGPFNWKRMEADPRLAEPDYAVLPLLVFRVSPHRDGPGAGELPTGTIPGVNLDEAVREGWKRDFDLGGKRWTLRASYVKGLRGRILPGSMQLTVEGAGSARRTVLDRHAGLIFRAQEVLWAGDLTRDGRPDFLLRRTLLTGEIDHVLSVSRADGSYAAVGVTDDPDKPENGFSSGIEESEYETWRHANSPLPYPEYKLPVASVASPAAYALSGPMRVKGIAIHANPRDVEPPRAGVPGPQLSQSVALAPGVKRDLVFTFSGESYRLLAELVPTWQGLAEGPLYSPQLPFGAYGSGGGLTLVVSIQHKGVRQPLLVTQPRMDEGTMSLTAGDLDGSGRLSLTIDWMPHYNNAMSHTWTRADEPGRVLKRVSSFQSQGC